MQNTGTFYNSRYSNETFSSRSFYHSHEKGRHSREDDMLLLSGELKSGMFKSLDKKYCSTQKNHVRIPSHFISPNPDLFIRNAANGVLDSIFMVNDEQRRKPFTVPVVQVEINTDPYWMTGSKYT